MKKSLRIAGITAFLFFPVLLQAQKDSIRLACPLNEAFAVAPPKNSIGYNSADLRVVLMSNSDTIVKAVTNSQVTNIEVDEEGKYGVVLFAKFNGKDYYFWYSGMKRSVVKRPNMVKTGQALGYIAPGDKIEILMFEFETPLDPVKYLDCKGTLQKK